MKQLTAAQIKIGDVIIRENDHLGRHDDRLTVEQIRVLGKREFMLKGYWSGRFERASTLSSQGYKTIERNGERIGTFFVKYW